MTRKQSIALSFIAKYCEEHGYSPDMKEIAAAIGVTAKSAVHRLLVILEQDGYIRRAKGRARSIQIIDPGEVKLSADVFKLVQQYAEVEQISVDTAVNQFVRDALESA